MTRNAEYSKMSYAEYLRTPHWADVRAGAIERAGDRCQVCAKRYHLHVHHNNYSNLGNEPDVDLFVMCVDCHERYHGRGTYAASPTKADESRVGQVVAGLKVRLRSAEAQRDKFAAQVRSMMAEVDDFRAKLQITKAEGVTMGMRIEREKSK